MKTKLPHCFTTITVVFFLSLSSLKAQTALQAVQLKTMQQNGTKATANNYSFRLYKAPNNAYGYDILMNGQPVYHQFVLFYVSPAGKRFFTSKEQTEKIAKSALNKLKQNKEPDITQQEIKAVMKL